MIPQTANEDQVRISRALDATFLSAEQSRTELTDFVAAAQSINAYGVCLFPKQIAYVDSPSDGPSDLKLITVVGFPHGADLIGAKAWQGTLLAASVDEFDYVPDLDSLLSNNWAELGQELKRFRAATHHASREHVLKVILETALLSERQIFEAVRVCVDAGMDFVKTSTGVHPAGGASLEAVETMVRASQGDIQVKASGGIRTVADGLRYLDAGASRLGSTQLVNELAGLSIESEY